MQILQYPLGQLQANCYFLIQDEECLIIDPADDAGFILEELQRRNLQLVGMLATHGHFDHVMAAGEIQQSFNIPLYISRKDLFLINRLVKTAEHFLGYKPAILKPTNMKYLNERKLEIKNWQLEILSTPGHTPGSSCFYFSKEKTLFTGDTLFRQGIGRYDHSHSSKKDLDNSLKEIFRLPEKTIVYPGHGKNTTIMEEKKAF
ncbi:MBL fold metallo-hydrolase [Candidatus Roizmanbacteria bacterium]|nr:MBL fold metallo-hydrolase [Candidatus Roizmanbacteria bacterium]